MAGELQTHMAMKIPFHTNDGREFFIGPYTMQMVIELRDWILRKPLRVLKKEFDLINKGNDDGVIDLETFNKIREDEFKRYLARKCEPIDLGQLWEWVFTDSENLVEFFRKGLEVNHPEITMDEAAELINDDTIEEIADAITQANGLTSPNPTNPPQNKKQEKQRMRRKKRKKK